MKREKATYLKIVGFKHSEIKTIVQLVIERAKEYRLPDEWEDIIELLTGNEDLFIKEV